MIGRKDPLEYLQERVEKADVNDVKGRLDSHLIPFDHLAKAHYDGLTGQALKDRLETDFNDFLAERARLVEIAITRLAQGDRPRLDEILKPADGPQGIAV